MKYRFNKDELQEIVSACLSIAEVCRTMGIVPAGGNYTTVNSKIREFGIDISHFTGQVWNIGDRYKRIRDPKPLDTILVKSSTYLNTTNLKGRLFRDGVKSVVCECCGLSEWMSNPIPTELHHIDGDRANNQLDNLQILCPNCHALTHNYRGRNINGPMVK